MYGHPIIGLYGHKPNPKPKRKRGRPSDWSKFVERQRDLFAADLYLARLVAQRLTK